MSLKRGFQMCFVSYGLYTGRTRDWGGARFILWSLSSIVTQDLDTHRTPTQSVATTSLYHCQCPQAEYQGELLKLFSRKHRVANQKETISESVLTCALVEMLQDYLPKHESCCHCQEEVHSTIWYGSALTTNSELQVQRQSARHRLQDLSTAS